MRSLYLFILIAVAGLSSAARGQTAREYYQEAARSGGLNALATLVCFDDIETGSFAIAARSGDFAETLKSKGLQTDPAFDKAANSGADELLFWQAFDKGVPGAKWWLKRSKEDDSHWSMKFDGVANQPLKGEILLGMNWATLRYRLDIQLTKAVPIPFYGRCERIR